MSTFEIVAISMLCGMFGLALLAGVAALIWIALDIRRSHKADQVENEAIQNGTRQALAAFYEESKSLLAENQREMKTTIESAKSAFAAIRAETKANLDGNHNKLTALLDEQRKAMQAAIDKINAEALTAAATRCFDACTRLERAISVFQKLILENTDTRTPNTYGSDDFAEEDSPFAGPPSGYGVSTPARTDQEAEDEAAALTESRGN